MAFGAPCADGESAGSPARALLKLIEREIAARAPGCRAICQRWPAEVAAWGWDTARGKSRGQWRRGWTWLDHDLARAVAHSDGGRHPAADEVHDRDVVRALVRHVGGASIGAPVSMLWVPPHPRMGAILSPCQPRFDSIAVLLPVGVRRLISVPARMSAVRHNPSSGVLRLLPAITDGAMQKFREGEGGIKSSGEPFSVQGLWVFSNKGT